MLPALLLAGGLIVADHARPDWFTPLRARISLGLDPFYRLAAFPGQVRVWLEEQAHGANALRRENAALRAEILLANVRLQRFAELQAENFRLRGLLDNTLAGDGRMLVANVSGVDPDPLKQVVLLDKGADDGVMPGLPVLDGKGVLGQVTDVTGQLSKVMLVTDSRHAVPVRDQRSGVRAILNGVGNGRLRLSFVPESADIVTGDLLVTSGVGDRFPAGYPVASVSRVTRTGGGEFARIEAQPVADGNARHVVLLLRSGGRLPTGAAAPPAPAEGVPRAQP